jgi:plastocyanin
MPLVAQYISPGASYSTTITAAGTYDYHCHLHAGMTGALQVR